MALGHQGNAGGMSSLIWKDCPLYDINRVELIERYQQSGINRVVLTEWQDIYG